MIIKLKLIILKIHHMLTQLKFQSVKNISELKKEKKLKRRNQIFKSLIKAKILFLKKI